MIRYGLKLWTSNAYLFEEAAQRFQEGAFDFIEFYYHPDFPLDAAMLRPFAGIPMGVHAPHELDRFVFGEKELDLWRRTKAFVDLANGSCIVVHPGYARSIPDFAAFRRELIKIDDARILIETMPGLDSKGVELFGTDLEMWKRFKEVKPICFDVQKVIKSAVYHKHDWRTYVAASLRELQPTYGHISGGETSHAIDQHADLWDSDIDWSLVKHELEALPQDIRLVFETPKNGKDLANDLDNMAFFRKVGS